MNTKIVIYEDNNDLREGLSVLLKGTAGYEVLGAFANCGDIEQQIANLLPDVVLMDIDMPIRNGIEGLKLIHQQFPDIYVVMLTVFETNEFIFEAICAGAAGYLLKKSPPIEILKAIEDVKTGGAPMTPSVARQVLNFFPKKEILLDDSETLSSREMEVLELLTKGFTYRMAAYELGISSETVRTYIKRIYTKLHVHSNTEAVAKAFQQNIFKK
ncbi:MAG: response regulator transcription factor [Arcicella sp.]|nr:response regulator transcription factor [Arcicella sp.]